MPRNGSGSYSLPQSAFSPNTTISSSAVNSNFSDIATALSGSVSADGQTPLTGTIKFASGSGAAPGITFSSDSTTGLFLSATGILGIGADGASQVLVDGTSDNPLQLSNGATICPIGSVMDFAGSTAPDGWLLLYGQEISQITYSKLYTVLGSTYNDGSELAGNFRLPDCRGRTTAGKDDMGGTAASRMTSAGSGVDGTTLGDTGGEETHTLTEAELASHAHTQTGQQPTFHFTVNSADWSGGGQATVTSISQSSGAGTITTAADTSPGDTDTAGSDDAHNNVQPTIVFNKIIFSGVV